MLRIFSVAVLLSVMSLAPAAWASGSAVIDPLVVSALEARESTAVWVFFRDKDIDDLGAALRELEQTYHPRAVERRRLRRSAPGLFDARDLPVAQSYVDAVAEHAERIRVRSRWLNAVSAEVTAAQLDAIAALPCVRSIELVRRAEDTDFIDLRQHEGHDLNPGYYGLATDQLEAINLPAVHAEGWTGEGVIIGVLDTGFKRTHDSFNDPENPLQVVAEYDYIDDDPNTGPEAGDDPNQHHHGTIILGTMAAFDPGTYVGAAYEASFILCKTEDITDEYQQEEDFYVAGLEFIESNGGDLATSSLRYSDWYTQQDMDGQTAVTTIAVNTATQNGVHCCTAVGNSGHDQNPETSSLGAPADAFQVFSVGSANIFGEESGFSSDGPTADGRVKPEVLTVGESAISISPSDDAGYIEASGTSMATPQMAACVACLLQSRPALPVDAMREAFFFTASDYVWNGTYDPNYVRGYGMVDAHAALNAAGPATAPITNVTISTGTILSGGAAELEASDDAYLVARSGFGVTFLDLHHMQLEIEAVAAEPNATTVEIEIESRIDEPAGTAQVRALNHTTAEFDLVRQYGIGPADEPEIISNLSGADYVGPGGEIEVVIKHIVFAPFLAFTFESRLDLVEIRLE